MDNIPGLKRKRLRARKVILSDKDEQELKHFTFTVSWPDLLLYGRSFWQNGHAKLGSSLYTESENALIG
jgi:hypothetical protein